MMISMASRHFTILYLILLRSRRDALKYPADGADNYPSVIVLCQNSVAFLIGFDHWFFGGCHEEWETLRGRRFVPGSLDADGRRFAAFGLRHCRGGRPGHFVVWKCSHWRRRPD